MDAAAYMRALEVELSKKKNVQVIYPCKVNGIDKVTRTIETDRGGMQFDLLINSAGLWADEIHNMSCRNEDFQMCSLYQVIPFKGEYYTWRKGHVQTMIYPVPSRFLKANDGDATLVSSMGIHTHRNIAGELLVGPSQVKERADKKDDYKIETPPEVFAKEISKFIKDIDARDLEPAYAGNRPKLYKDGHPIGDFHIFKEGNIIHLMGMESPALTAAPAIARYVIRMI
jgi:glycerol-3-phosphate dehydrogenase